MHERKTVHGPDTRVIVHNQHFSGFGFIHIVMLTLAPQKVKVIYVTKLKNA